MRSTNPLDDAQSIERKRRAFQRFMDEPMTKLAISMLPEPDNKDILPNLLRSAFDVGHGAGAGEIAVAMLTAVLESKKSPQ